MQHPGGCQYIHTIVNSRQFTLYRMAGVRCELCDHLITGRNEKHPWSTRTFVSKVREIIHHDVVSYGIFADQFPEMHPREWKKQALITLEEATEVYMVEILATSHCLKQQLISCRCSTCLL